MAQIQKERRIVEERNFTNPQVRFRRIRGRIVPIYNKKRIGQDISSLGETVFKAGVVASGFGLAKKTHIGKGLGSFSKKVSRTSLFKKISSIADKALKSNSKSFKAKAAKLGTRASLKTGKFAIKNVGKLGALGLAVGVGIKLLGDNEQAKSAFGKDFAFIKDRAGRGS